MRREQLKRSLANQFPNCLKAKYPAASKIKMVFMGLMIVSFASSSLILTRASIADHDLRTNWKCEKTKIFGNLATIVLDSEFAIGDCIFMINKTRPCSNRLPQRGRT